MTDKVTTGILQDEPIHLVGLNEGFRVRHIASCHLATCCKNDDREDVLRRPDFSDFDQIPIKDGDRIVGVLERDGDPNRPIDDSVLVSSEQPLTDFIRTLKSQSYRLVLTGTSITGIVTWSDMMKPPVFVLVYSLVSQLEMLMTERIRSRYPQSETWLKLLDEKAQKKILSRRRRLERANLALDLIESSDLQHKGSILKDLFSQKLDFAEQLRAIVELRHSTDHVKDFVKTPKDLKNFVDQIELTEAWIACLKRTQLETQNSQASA